MWELGKRLLCDAWIGILARWQAHQWAREKSYPASWKEGVSAGSHRKTNGDEIEPMFTTSNTGSLKNGMCTIFVVQQLCEGLPHKVQNPNPNIDKTITGLGLHGGGYFHLVLEVIRESDKNHLITCVAPLLPSHKLQGTNINIKT